MTRTHVSVRCTDCRMQFVRRIESATTRCRSCIARRRAPEREFAAKDIRPGEEIGDYVDRKEREKWNLQEPKR